MDTMDNPITPPLPSPSFAVPSLDTLPSDIILQIASDSDESTLWAMRGTCHALRDSTEKALEPFLKEKRVTVKPEFMVDAYNAIPPLSSADDTARQSQLRAITQKFTNHLASFPPSSTLLKRLVIELRDDAADAGWAQLAKLAPQLESAEIHIFDRFWQKQPIPANHPNPARSHFIPHDHLYPALHFPLLTTLTVVGTARVMQHLGHIALFAPNLRALTLGNHWTRCEDAEEFEDGNLYNMPSLFSPCLLDLEQLSITGSDAWMHQFLDSTFILGNMPRLHHLTIYRLPSERYHFGPSDPPLRRLAEAMACSDIPLAGLAIYGMNALEFVGEMERAQRSGPHFHQLSMLTVELSDRFCGDFDPMLEEPRPHLPSLRRMIWVHTGTPEKSSKHGRAAQQGDTYNEAAFLRHLDIYPSLSQVQRLAEYPADPFAPIDMTLRAGGEVLCCVNRADGMAD